jgi:hypothetical protein
MDDAHGQEEYVRQVLDAYRKTPGTMGTVRRADRLLAAQLYQRGLSLKVIENALVLATRRLIRPPDAPPSARFVRWLISYQSLRKFWSYASVRITLTISGTSSHVPGPRVSFSRKARSRRAVGRMMESNPYACGVDDIASLPPIPTMHAFGVDDDDGFLIQVLFPVLFLEWITSPERYWVTFAKR